MHVGKENNEMIKVDWNEYGSGVVIKYGQRKDDSWITKTFKNGTTEKDSSTSKILESTRFDIASLTKTFTAILVHQAVEEGRFNFQSTIQELDPKFQNLNNITILDLLCHNQEIWTEGYLGDVKNKEEFSKILYTAYIKSTHPKYVDVHYIILSVILEKIYQCGFESLLEEKISKPLNLKNTSFQLKESESYASCDLEMLNNEIIHVPERQIHDKKARAFSRFHQYVGHAGLFSTAEDIFTVLASLIDDSYLLLNEKSINHFFEHDNYIDLINDYTVNHRTHIRAPYTYGGMRYTIPDSKYNVVHIRSNTPETYLFSGYTGPIYWIDKKEKIIIVVMINSVHKSRKTRKERLDFGMNLIEQIYNQINQ